MSDLPIIDVHWDTGKHWTSKSLAPGDHVPYSDELVLYYDPEPSIYDGEPRASLSLRRAHNGFFGIRSRPPLALAADPGDKAA